MKIHRIRTVFFLALLGVLSLASCRNTTGGESSAAPEEETHAEGEHTADKHSENEQAEGGHAKSEHAGDGSTVELSLTQYQSAGIELGTVQSRNLNYLIRANGLLDVPPQNSFSISAPMGGFVRATPLLEGMKVKKGQLLATLQNPDFVQLQQDYLDNKSKLTFAWQEYQRQRELSRENVSALKTFQQTTADYHSLQAVVAGLEEKLRVLGIRPQTLDNGRLGSQIHLYAPISGYVTTVNVNLGKYVNPTDVLFELTDTEHIHVELTIYEKDLGRIRVGQPVRFSLTTEPGKEYRAKVYLINRKISEDRTVRVHCHLEKEDAGFVPNTYVTAQIETTAEQLPVLPDQAIVSSEGKDYVFVETEETGKETHADGGRHFRRIEVGKGISDNGYTHVRFPPSFDLKTPVVLKGAYTLLSVLQNASGEEEGHAH
jgi:cobalt-zinc-cadmium efflux system membrane fusion protein